MVKNNHVISRKRAFDFLSGETEGRIFSAYFQKTNGVMRQMICRVGVKSRLRGGQLTYDRPARGHITVYDMKNKGYRTLNSHSLVSFNIGGESFTVV